MPSVVGQPVRLALQTLVDRRLRRRTSTSRRKAGQRLGVVPRSTRRKGRLTSYYCVMLVVPRVTHGVVPKVVGLKLMKARKRLRISFTPIYVSTSLADGDPGHVLAQRPRAGVAAAANMTVKLVVGRT